MIRPSESPVERLISSRLRTLWRIASAEFDRVFVQGSLPSAIEEASVDGGVVHLPELLASLFGGSRSDARRKIAQGGVRLDGEPVSELDLPAESLDGRVLQVGKRQFRRLRAV